MLKTLTLVTLVAVTACSGGKKPTTTTTTSKATVELALGEMKLIDVTKNQAVQIHADGTIEMPDGKKPAKVTAEGKLVDLATNKAAFELHADGSVKSVDGKVSGPMISAEGVVTMGDKTMSVDAEGNLVGGNPDAPKMKVEGATDANLKRTAMFVLVVLTTASAAAGAPTLAPAP